MSLPLYPSPSRYPIDNDCSNCNRELQEGEELTWLYEWGFWACEDCARLCDLTEQAEFLCSKLHDEVIAAKTVKEVQEIFRHHVCDFCIEERKRAA